MKMCLILGVIGSRCRVVIDLQGPFNTFSGWVCDLLTCSDLKISRTDAPRQFDGQFLCQARHPEAWE